MSRILSSSKSCTKPDNTQSNQDIHRVQPDSAQTDLSRYIALPVRDNFAGSLNAFPQGSWQLGPMCFIKRFGCLHTYTGMHRHIHKHQKKARTKTILQFCDNLLFGVIRIKSLRTFHDRKYQALYVSHQNWTQNCSILR